jgi:trimeric autotransporter adhesin
MNNQKTFLYIAFILFICLFPGSIQAQISDLQPTSPLNQCSGTPAQSTITSPTSTFCTSGSTTLSLSNSYIGQGITYQWAYSTSSGGPYTNLLGNANTQITGTLFSTRYYVCTINCTFGNTQITTPEKAIVVSPQFFPNITGNPNICAGNSATLDAGAGYASYAWSNGVTTQTLTTSIAGNYSVTLTTPLGCTATASRTVVVSPLPIPSITGTSTICSGNSTTLGLTTTYTSYNWSTGGTGSSVTVSMAGTYTITVTNFSGCSASTSTTITLSNQLSPTITGGSNICLGNSTTLDAGAGYTNYQWSNGATTQAITTANAQNYTVTVTNASGCSGTASKTITQSPTPTTTIVGASTICQGSSTTLNAGLGFSTYAWSNAATTQSITVSIAGTYTVTITNSSGCTATAVKTVTFNNQLTPTITGASSFCQGSSTTLDAGTGYNTYSWSSGSSSQTLSANTAGTYTVTVTNASGCTGTASKTITQSPLPTTSITGASTICQGSSTTLDAGAGFSTYAWSNAATTQSITVSAAGTYTVTITNSSGCTATAVKITTLSNQLSPSITGASSFCQGSSTTLDAGTGYTTYTWSSGNTNQTLTVNTTGTYTITVTNTSGCTGTASKTITQSPPPTTTIAGESSICPGGSITLDAGAGFSTYAWSNGTTSQSTTISTVGTYSVTITNAQGCSASASKTITSSNQLSPSILGAASFCAGASTTLNAGLGYTSYSWSGGGNNQTLVVNSAGTYTVTVTNASGCFGTASKAVSITPLPTTTILGNSTFCAGSSVILDAGTGFSNYQWSNGANTQSITATTAQTYTVTITNSAGCSNSATKILTLNPSPSTTITGASSFCAGGSTILDAGAGFTNYQWSNGTNAQTITVVNAQTYTVTITNASSCTSTAFKTITITPLPTTTITGAASFCAGTTTTIDAGAGFSSYQWSNGATTQTINPTTPQTYTVTITNSNGCSSTASKIVTINPLPTTTIAGSTTFCAGGSSTLDAGAGFSNYLWSNGATTQSISTTTAGTYTTTVTNANGCTATASITLILSAQLSPSILGATSICQGLTANLDAGTGYSTYIWNTGATTQTISVTAAGSYSVTVTSSLGCSGTATRAISVSPPPTTTITGATSFCIGSNTTLNAGVGFSNYQWSNGINAQAITITASQLPIPNPQTYTVTITNSQGCTNTATALVTVNPLPILSILNLSSTYCIDANPVTLSGQPSGGIFKVDGQTTPTFTPSTLGTGNHTVFYTYTDANTCMVTLSRTVVVNPTPQVSIQGMPPTIRVNSPNANLIGIPSGGTISGRGVTSNIFRPAIAGLGPDTITYFYTDPSTGCTGRATIIINVDAASISTNDQQPTTNEIRLYPNPTTGDLNIENTSTSQIQQPTQIRIVDVLGKIVFDQNLVPTNKIHQINIGQLPTGTYFVQCKSEGTYQVKKIVKL